MLHEREPNMLVNRLELIDKVKENRAKHKDRYDTMCKGYKVLVAEANEEFQKKLAEELENKQPHAVDHSRLYNECFRHAGKPNEHLRDYDEVIEMLTWIKEEEVRISLSQFREWVRDQWGWYGAFIREGELPLAKSEEYCRRWSE